MAERLLLSFKDNDQDKELLCFVREKSRVIGHSSYLKQLIYTEMKKEKESKSPAK